MSKSKIVDKYIDKLLDKERLTKEEAQILIEYLRPKPKTLLEQLVDIINFINGGTK